MSVEEKICNVIMQTASIYAKKTITTMDEVDALYDSKTFQGLNDEIDYILYGEC